MTETVKGSAKFQNRIFLEKSQTLDGSDPWITYALCHLSLEVLIEDGGVCHTQKCTHQLAL